MTTVADLVSQVEDHLLGGDRDEINRLTNFIDGAQQTISLDFELGGVAAGSYLTIDFEVLYVWSVDPTSFVVTVQRGMLNSTPQTHDAGTIVYINPLFSKWEIFKAINVEIVSISGADNGLFAEKSFTLTTLPVSMNYDVPADNSDLRTILEIRWDQIGPERPWPALDRRSFQIVRNLQTDTGTSGVSLRIERPTSGFIPGRRLVVQYAGDFDPLPPLFSVDVSSTNLADSMLDIPALGAAARLMGVREAKRAFVERDVDSRRASEVTSGSASRAAAVLMQLLEGRIKSEADRLRQRWPLAL